MTDNRLFFGSFTVERRYDARPERVFRAFTDRAVKQAWLGCEEVTAPVIEQLDFRIDGREVSRGGGQGGAEHLFEGRYLDIVDGRRFTLAFVMHVGGKKLSASILTVEILPDADGARLLFTEQGVYFGEDGWAEREEGTAFGMEQLARWLALEKETA